MGGFIPCNSFATLPTALGSYLARQLKHIGKINIPGADRKAGDDTVLTMKIDRSGLMELKAVDKRTGKTVEAEIQLDDY